MAGDAAASVSAVIAQRKFFNINMKLICAGHFDIIRAKCFEVGFFYVIILRILEGHTKGEQWKNERLPKDIS